MNEIEQLREFCKNEGVYGLIGVLIEPDGLAHEYTRLIDTEHMPQMIRSVKNGKNSPLFQFYTDDMGFALLNALPDTQSDTSENDSLQEEPNIDTNVPKSPDSSPDTTEEGWESEGGSYATHNDDV